VKYPELSCNVYVEVDGENVLLIFLVIWALVIGIYGIILQRFFS
jgi:hypothetical protein